MAGVFSHLKLIMNRFAHFQKIYLFISVQLKAVFGQGTLTGQLSCITVGRFSSTIRGMPPPHGADEQWSESQKGDFPLGKIGVKCQALQGELTRRLFLTSIVCCFK